MISHLSIEELLRDKFNEARGDGSLSGRKKTRFFEESAKEICELIKINEPEPIIKTEYVHPKGLLGYWDALFIHRHEFGTECNSKCKWNTISGIPPKEYLIDKQEI